MNGSKASSLKNDVSDIIRDVARSVIVPRFRLLEKHEIEEKKGGSLVTIADRESEALLTQKLSALLPGSAVLGEESFEEDPSVADRLNDTEWVWIVDPVDGTHNFAHGSPTFGVILGLARHNEMHQAWLYDVMNDRMITAERGQGAWDEKTGARISVRHVNELKDMTAQIGGYVEHHYTKGLEAAGVTISRLRCSLHDFLQFSTGESQMLLHKKTKPWDHAPTTLVAQEAGGYVALQDGSPYTPSTMGEMLLAATDKKNWEKLAAMIF